jgi:hypothetical protein
VQQISSIHMPNPYEQLFGNEDFQQRAPDDEALPSAFPMPPPPENQQDPLDAILEKIAAFQQNAEPFSVLMSQTRAVDHEVSGEWLALFVNTGGSHNQGNLSAEKDYHALLIHKFRNLIEPMKELALLHLETLKAFILEIDDAYYSIEKADVEIKTDKERAVDGLNLQRKILAEAARNLDILDQALEACERRMKRYINAGGANNLSAAELALIAKNRSHLCSGREHGFDYTFFNINLLDKAAMTFGFLMKETSSQYLQKLLFALENR